MKLKHRVVHYLHKLTDEGIELLRSRKMPEGLLPPKKEVMSHLAVGRVFVFPRSKTAYRVTVTGAVVRANPKPWRNKAEQKRWKKARRLERGKSE